jgi:hypothetical protein
MTGNSQVRFLGEGDAATYAPLPDICLCLTLKSYTHQKSYLKILDSFL